MPSEDGASKGRKEPPSDASEPGFPLEMSPSSKGIGAQMSLPSEGDFLKNHQKKSLISTGLFHRRPRVNFAATLSHDRALPARIHSYEQSGQPTAQSPDPWMPPQKEGKPTASPPIATTSSLIDKSPQIENDSQDTSQKDPQSRLQKFLQRNRYEPSSDPQPPVNQSSFFPHAQSTGSHKAQSRQDSPRSGETNINVVDHLPQHSGSTAPPRAQHNALGPDSINEFLEDHRRRSSRDRRLIENGASFDQPPPLTPRHSRTRPAIVTPGRQHNLAPTPAPARNRRTSSATVASSSTGMNSVSDAFSWHDSYYNSYPDSIYTDALALPSVTGTIAPPRNGAYMLPCEFVSYASCDQYFHPEAVDQWMGHIIVDHLGSRLPDKSACWYCDDFDFDASRDGVDKMIHFRNRLDHIRVHITEEGLGVENIRPDYAFIAHLEKNGLIPQPESEPWQEGPVSGVTGIYEHDWVPPERQQPYGQSQAVVINEKPRGRKSNKHSDGHKRIHRAYGARRAAKSDDSSRTTHNKAESIQSIPSDIIPATGIPNTLHEGDAFTGINSSKHQKAVMAKSSKLKPEALKSEHLPPPGFVNSADELIGDYERQSKNDRIPQHGFQQQLDPKSKMMKQQSHTSPPNHTSSTANEENEAKDLDQTIQSTLESYPSSPSSFLSAEEVPSLLDEADVPHDTLTYQGDLLAEGTQTEQEHLGKTRLSPSSTNELLGSHEKQSTSDQISFHRELDVKNDMVSLDSAAAGGSSRQEVQAPTDSGYASGLHPNAMQVETHDEQAWNQGLYSAQTTYTYSNISSSEDRGYTSEFATELAQVSDLLNLSLGAAGHILEVLPQLLRAFALRLGYNANSAVHREIYVFVHRHRFQIRKSLRSMLPIEDTGSDADDCETIRDTSLNGEFSINRYLQEPVAQEYLPIGCSPDAEDEQDEQDVEIDGHQFRGMIQHTKAYQWLITALKREANLIRSTPDIMQQVEADILSFLPESPTVSRRQPPQAYTIEFQLDWNPLLFARQQEYLDPPDLSLQRAITLTGSSNNAQALTARQYLAQTWPNTGNLVMDLIADAVRAANNPQSSSILPDGTGITVQLTGDKFIVTAKGIADTLVEVGQQFAWLGAALRSSPYDSGIATCVPVIERIDNDTPFVGQTISIIVTFAVGGPFLRSKELLSGACWHPMFRNPVMVSGYPIRSRLEKGLGLEMTLNMMAELSGSTRADLFDGKVFLKGFSTMLIATKQAHDIIVWHYFYNADRDRMSYFDHALGNVDNISLSSLNSARHVIGWCEDCKLFTGDPVLAGNIQRIRLPPPHAGCLLEKVNLSFSQFITGGVSMAVGVKDRPPYVTRNGYIPELRHLATRYIVLWDEADKRGWLVNGTNALLLIVRASLQHWAKDDFSASFMFDESKMADTTDHKPGSASRILSDPKNLELEILLGK